MTQSRRLLGVVMDPIDRMSDLRFRTWLNWSDNLASRVEMEPVPSTMLDVDTNTGRLPSLASVKWGSVLRLMSTLLSSERPREYSASKVNGRLNTWIDQDRELLSRLEALASISQVMAKSSSGRTEPSLDGRSRTCP